MGRRSGLPSVHPYVGPGREVLGRLSRLPLVAGRAWVPICICTFAGGRGSVTVFADPVRPLYALMHRMGRVSGRVPCWEILAERVTDDAVVLRSGLRRSPGPVDLRPDSVCARSRADAEVVFRWQKTGHTVQDLRGTAALGPRTRVRLNPPGVGPLRRPPLPPQRGSSAVRTYSVCCARIRAEPHLRRSAPTVPDVAVGRARCPQATFSSTGLARSWRSPWLPERVELPPVPGGRPCRSTRANAQPSLLTGRCC